MAKRWDEPRPRAPQAIVSRTNVTTGALMLGAVVGAGVIGTGLGSVIGKAVVAVVRSVFTAVGGFLAR